MRAFWESGETERFGLSGSSGDHVDYMRRRDAGDATPRGVETYSRDLHGVRMDQLASELRETRQLVESIESRDLRRGFTLTLLLLLGAAWLVSLAPLIYIAHRVSQPIQQLTAGLTDFAAGDWSRRLDTGVRAARRRGDEVGRAVDAFNRMADQLRQSRERLVHLTRMASWQSLARKTAHELKNSLTPIRLTVEEMQARQPPADRAFMDQAVQIVVSEIDSLERRVRAFSEFASEPPVIPRCWTSTRWSPSACRCCGRRIRTRAGRRGSTTGRPASGRAPIWCTASSPICCRMPPRPPGRAARCS